MVGEIGLIYSSEISDQPDQNTDLSVERGKLFAIKSMLLSFSRTLVDCHRFFFIPIDRIDTKTLSLFIATAVWIVRPATYTGKNKKRLHGRKTAHFKVLSVDSEHSSIADHLVNTGHNMKWYYFEILAGGKTSKHCLIKREPTDKEHWPTLSTKIMAKSKKPSWSLYYSDNSPSLSLYAPLPPPPTPISMLKSWHVHIQTLQEKY